MKRHLLCLTIDTDPDGLSGKTTNRNALRWDGLEQLSNLPEQFADFPSLGRIPITWFVRADGQLESILGCSTYLLEKYSGFWTTVTKAGDELGWHPHLYRQANRDVVAQLITDPSQAQDELERLWASLKTSLLPKAFRNGEGWHTPGTYATVERLGFNCDSTAIPGRAGSDSHPMNWSHAPNQPYFPAADNLCATGAARPMLEIPMNTWLLKAPYDQAPRRRYMNPAVHPDLFAKTLKNWENECNISHADLSIWVMIFHPDEVLCAQSEDGLYARSTNALCKNLACIEETMRRLEHEFEWTTISRAAERWRGHLQHAIA